MSELEGSFWVLRDSISDYLKDKNKDILTILSSSKKIHDKTVQQALLAACVEHNRKDVIEKYITDINIIIEDQESKVSALECVYHTDMLLYLIQKGIDIFFVNNAGDTIVEEYILRDDLDKPCLLSWVSILVSNGFLTKHATVRNLHNRPELLESFLKLGFCVDTYNFILTSDMRGMLLVYGQNPIWSSNMGYIITSHFFDYIIQMLHDAISSIVLNNYSVELKEKLQMKDGDLVEYKPVGTNFTKVPFHQLIDALHVFLYGKYAPTHPFYKETNDKECLYRLDYIENEKDIENEFERVKDLQKIIPVVLKNSKLGQEIANEDCETALKKYKKDCF